MKAVNKQSGLRPDAFAISIWENEGGAPARIGGRLMLGLSCQEATDSMVSTNQSNVMRRPERGWRLAWTPQQEQ
ncbi:hypothetical protein M2322_003670 [Rhodoblastus acidophilus]|uniref:hypothetical protein n=1 Tax=Rhodoblastus acidophilus TaxID=1074 RepID=UPI0022252844|nr:hypothetical protein [Rhodoblastus acidophilus]MCW2318103.1 hypothetical protein [Rhodoblastus acidophilus]